MKNFHLPLPEQTYSDLRAAAQGAGVPATALAREAIDEWLREQLRKQRHKQIAAYAAEVGGTDVDLDADLEYESNLMKEATFTDETYCSWRSIIAGPL